METLLTAVVPAFALIAIGYGAVRLRILGPAIFPALNSFVYYLAMPALLIASLAGVPAVEIINWNFIAVFSIGIINRTLQPVVVNNRLRNVPAEGFHNWNPGAYFGVYRPDTFWFAGKGKDRG